MKAPVETKRLEYRGRIFHVSKCGRIFRDGDFREYARSEGESGYVKIFLLLPDRKRTGASVHRLVALAYLPNPENKPDVNHVDGNKSNNNLENLEWATRYENIKHAYETGLMDNKRKRDYKEERNLAIKRLAEAGITHDIIANAFDCSQPNISRIINNFGRRERGEYCA